MLRAENLAVQRGPCTVLADINLELRPGEVLGVLGPNGAGKSTLLGALCGELQPSHGDVWLSGGCRTGRAASARNVWRCCRRPRR